MNSFLMTLPYPYLQSKASLLSKAMFSFHSLAFSTNLVMEHGKGLKYSKLAFLCYGKYSTGTSYTLAQVI